jgi:hypothetical protein
MPIQYSCEYVSHAALPIGTNCTDSLSKAVDSCSMLGLLAHQGICCAVHNLCHPHHSVIVQQCTRQPTAVARHASGVSLAEAGAPATPGAPPASPQHRCMTASAALHALVGSDPR